MGSTNRERKHEVFDDVQDRESRVKPPTSQRRLVHKKNRMRVKSILNFFDIDEVDMMLEEFEDLPS